MNLIIIKTNKSETKKFPLTLIAPEFKASDMFFCYYVFIMKTNEKKEREKK
tara:strand:+ start:287 stop:439 length:153 start_codon:yes stop_codon:yes gene_type:complete